MRCGAAAATAAANKYLQKDALEEKYDQERVEVARDVHRVCRSFKQWSNRWIWRCKDLKNTQRVIRALDGDALWKVFVESVESKQDGEEKAFDEQKQVGQNP